VSADLLALWGFWSTFVGDGEREGVIPGAELQGCG
jgi:hypothetical protein